MTLQARGHWDVTERGCCIAEVFSSLRFVPKSLLGVLDCLVVSATN